MFDLVLYGDRVLRSKSKPVESLTTTVKRLSAGMLLAMKKFYGVGLAAPQVGKALRLAVLYHPEFHPKPLTLINPKIIGRSDDLTSMDEGCLSVPELSVSVTRPRVICVSFTDLKGKQVEREFSDMMARIVQHECDHLDGKMIVDHLDLPARMQFETRVKLGIWPPAPRAAHKSPD